MRDTSGGVLPGVTVVAASPALIEKEKTVFTDGEGRYSIVDLRPGNYTVTFTLPGFATVVRDGIVLGTGFTATYRLQGNVDLYNAMNSNSVLSLVTTYGSRWKRPLAILDARLLQLSGQLSF